MVNVLKGVVWDKYLGSEIDQMTIFFNRSSANTEVGEFEVPETERHMVFYASDKNNGAFSWVSIVNPDDVFKRTKATLPDITVKVKEKTYELKDLIDIFVAAEK